MRHKLPAVLLLFVSAAASAQVPAADSLSISGEQLDSIVVSARRNRIELATAPGSEANISLSAVKKIPSVLGAGDPLRFTAFLPSVQTGNDMDSGLHIQGCENNHNFVSMNGAPVYGAGHMLGFASVFNSAHFTDMSYNTLATRTNRLGGTVNMAAPSSLVHKPGLEASAGMFLSQLTASLPAGRSSFYLSARHTYFNVLYKDFLLFNNRPFRYDFGDYNATWLWKPGEKDAVTFNAYFGKDYASYDVDTWGIDVSADWLNALASLDWKHKSEGWTLSQSIYGSFYQLEDDVRMNATRVEAPSDIMTYGYNAYLSAGGFELSAGTAFHITSPMQPRGSDKSFTQQGWETTLQAGYVYRSRSWLLSGSVRGTWYLSPENKSFWSADPKLELAYTTPSAGIIGLRTGTAHQYLFQTGPGRMGLPCEYWILASDLSAPQSSRYASISWNSGDIWDGWNISVEGYWKNLSNQLEYWGAIMDYTYPDFRLEDQLIHCKGRNYGINLHIQKTEGRLTGWISYAYGRALRHSDIESWPQWYPSVHERLHEGNLVAVYDFGKWDAGMTFVAAAGSPYTEQLGFYLSGGKILTVYGEHNATRLKPYIRADFSANWYFSKTERLRHGLNLSVYNVTAHANELGRMLKIDEDGRYYFGEASLALSILPSIGYFIRF